MNEHIDYISACRVCHTEVEHVTGIPDPYWRHLTPPPMPHPAAPDPNQARGVTS